jgi:sulfide:quinone oxidoreductase
VICGAGVAGIEGLLRLRRLARDHVEVTLLSPEERFSFRPLAVLEPFASGGIRRYPIERIVSDAGASWIQDRVVRVDGDAGIVHTEEHGELAYDALLLAIGARESSPFAHARVFTGRDDGESFKQIVRDIEGGHVASVAFVLPDGPTWPLPLCELALMTAARARSLGVEIKLAFVTPELTPLKAFGPAADEAILQLLADAGIELHTGAKAQIPTPHEVVLPGTRLQADWIVTLPRISGVALPGVPAGERWFVPIDHRCRVKEMPGHVYAAGDITDVLIKHGGIGAQQADTAAAAIAHLAGAIDHPPGPLEPVVRGVLMTGNGPRFLAARLTATDRFHSEVVEHQPWPADEKIVAEELGPYLAQFAD